jgi:phage terminase small subunit
MLERMSVQDLFALSPQHKKFADEFLATNKVSASAVAAGYSARSAHVQGNRLLKRPDVQQYIAGAVAKADEQAEELSAQVIRELKTMAFANVADFITIDEDGKPQIDFSKVTPEQLRAISSVKSKTSRKFNGKGEHIATDSESAFVMADKYRGLELLGRHAGLFKTEEHRLVVDVADRLLAARRRLGSEYEESGEPRLLGGRGEG